MTNRVLFLNFIVLFSFLPFVATAENMSQSNFYIGGSGAFSHYPSYKPIRGKFNELSKSEKYLCKPLKPSASVLKIIYS